MEKKRQTLGLLLETGQIDIGRGSIFDLPPDPLPAILDWERVEGMMLSLAVGDALGCTSESQVPRQRQARYGEIRDYLPNRYADDRPVGLPSDDTQLAFWTLEQMIADQGFDPDHVAARFCQDRIFGIGSTVRRFVDNYRSGIRPWYRCGVKSAGNGALMRIAPMVIPHLKSGTSDLWVDTALSAMITHNDSASIAACLSFVNMLWKLLQMQTPPEPGWWLETYVEVARDLEADDTYRPRGGDFLEYQGTLWRFVEDRVGEAYRRGLSVQEACDAWYSGAFLLETVPSVLYILMRHGDDLEKAIIRAVNDTRDNDTIAAIVGAAVGALHGKAAIPPRWINNLSGRTTENDEGAIFDLLRRARQQWWPEARGTLLAVEDAFAAYFATWSIELPGAAVAARSSGELNQAGWTIRYLFGREGDREYLDFYAMHRMTNDRHVRIWEDGQTEHLESLEEMFVFNPEIPGDRERAEQEHLEYNRRVSETLKRKGLLK